jgi:AbrB family looped-hinge helix DNA binding protein
MNIHAKAVVSSKGQIVIPRKIREAFGIHPGSEFSFKIHKNVLELKPIKGSIKTFFGRCKQKNTDFLSVSDMDAAIALALQDNFKKTKNLIK